MLLTANQEEIVKGFNPDQTEEWLKLKDNEKLEMLEAIESMMSDKETILSADGDMKVTFDETSVTGKGEREDCLILKAGGLGLSVGTVIVARFLGTMPMFTDKKKEYWKEVKIGKKVWWMNLYFKFARTDGKEFGIYQSPMLRILKKVYTNSATPTITKEDPIVRLEYFGEINSIERLKEEFNFELQKGESAHAFRVYLSKNTVVDRYAVECVNFLRNPIPNEAQESTTKDMSELEKLEYAYGKQLLVNQGEIPQVGHNPQ
jgi:hypothetical protein